MSLPFLTRFDLSRTGWGWIAVYVVIIGAWGLLFAAMAEHSSRVPIEWLGPGMSWLAPFVPSSWQSEGLPPLIAALCLTGPGAGNSALPIVFHMWALMTLAMMLPTALPVIGAYRELTATRGESSEGLGLAAFTGGYIAVWLGFALAASLLQVWLARQGLLGAGDRISGGLAGLLLLVAGLYQLTPMKAMCLAHCRSPMLTLMAKWRAGIGGAFRMGAGNGLFCLGCCWALMLLAFVGGTMNLVWMGIATILMALEKLPRIGKPLTIPLGIALTVAGALTLVFTYGPPSI